MATVWVLMSGHTTEGGRLYGVFREHDKASNEYTVLVKRTETVWGRTAKPFPRVEGELFAMIGNAWVGLSEHTIQ